MKKHVFLMVCGCLFLSSALAQVKPMRGDFGLGFRLTGLQNIGFDAFDTDDTGERELPQLLVRYYLSGKIALRSTFGIRLNNSGSHYTLSYIDSVRFFDPVRVDSSNRSSLDQFSFRINPGIEYHLVSQATRIDPYLGLSIPVTLTGTTKRTEDLDYTQTVARNDVLLFREDISTRQRSDGGFRVGLDLLAGFNYFFTDNFSIGAEYAVGFGYSRMGGTVETTRTGVRQLSPNASDLEAVNESARFTRLNTSTELGVSATGGVNVSIFW